MSQPNNIYSRISEMVYDFEINETKESALVQGLHSIKGKIVCYELFLLKIWRFFLIGLNKYFNFY